MKLSTASVGLSADLVNRYALARKRFIDTTSASTNGTATGQTTSGVTGLGAKPVPTSSIGMTRCTDEWYTAKCEELKATPRGSDSAPLTTYTTTSTEHGEVYKASREYVDWLRRKVPGYGVESEVCRPAPGGTTGGEGMTF